MKNDNRLSLKSYNTSASYDVFHNEFALEDFSDAATKIRNISPKLIDNRYIFVTFWSKRTTLQKDFDSKRRSR